MQRGLRQRSLRASTYGESKRSTHNACESLRCGDALVKDMNDARKDGEEGYARIRWFLEVLTSFVLVALVAGSMFSLVL